MSDKNPCPFCGDDSEYSHFINLCAERANEIQRVNDLRTLTNMYNSMGYVQVVHCKNCKQIRDWTEDELNESYDKAELADGLCMFFQIGTYDDFFCAWGEKRTNLDNARNVQ